MISNDLIYEYHERVFGEEMARVNFLPSEERWKYVRQIWRRTKDREQKESMGQVLHGCERIWGRDLSEDE